jgi:hypothetical protein
MTGVPMSTALSNPMITQEEKVFHPKPPRLRLPPRMLRDNFTATSGMSDPTSLAKECYSMKLDLLTNATVVDDAIRFVSESERSKDKDKEQVKSSSSGSSDEDNNNKESNDPDYGDEKSDKVGKEKQEQGTGEIITNQVF